MLTSYLLKAGEQHLFCRRSCLRHRRRRRRRPRRRRRRCMSLIFRCSIKSRGATTYRCRCCSARSIAVVAVQRRCCRCQRALLIARVNLLLQIIISVAPFRHRHRRSYPSCQLHRYHLRCPAPASRFSYLCVSAYAPSHHRIKLCDS